MLPAALAAFVAGVFLLQQQAALPARSALAAFGLAAVAFIALALRAWRQPHDSRRLLAAPVLLAAACAAGFAYAGWRAPSVGLRGPSLGHYRTACKALVVVDRP